MQIITSSLEEVEKGLGPEFSNNYSQESAGSSKQEIELHPIFIANETVTMAKLHSLMEKNKGVYLNIMDEIEGLFKSLEINTGPDAKDRRTWLSLYNGHGWSWATENGRVNIPTTRLNYTGECSSVNVIYNILTGWQIGNNVICDHKSRGRR